MQEGAVTGSVKSVALHAVMMTGVVVVAAVGMIAVPPLALTTTGAAAEGEATTPLATCCMR